MGLKSITCFLLSFLFLYSHQKPLDAKQHLHTYGFLDNLDPSPKVLEEAIKKFQSTTDLKVTGTLNDETVAKMNSPRCGRPDNVPLFSQARDKWRKSHITYKISNFTEPFTKSQIKKVFEDAIMAWTDNVNLKITETTSNRADIEIHFTTQDGRNNVLGYAYFPENGDIYFDKDEDWTLAQSRARIKTGFTWVAVHELGHSLGMPHTETMTSIMFPYYSPDVVRPSTNDVNRMRRIYGEGVFDNSVLCEGTSVDALLNTETPILIKGRQYWTISSDDLLQKGPFSLDMLYPGLPDKIDAAFVVKKTIYFLSGDVFYRLKSTSSRWTQKLISSGFDNLPENIDAAFFDPSSSLIYFFKGSQYYALDIKKPAGKRLTVNGKSISNGWSGIPKDIEAATLLKNSRVLFIKDSRCYIMNLNTKQILVNNNCSSALYGC